jgi:hypothetical protein
VSSAPASTTSRAYWELKAEQVMDRVFLNAAHPGNTANPINQPAPAAPEPAATAPIDVAVREHTAHRWADAIRPLPGAIPIALGCSLVGLSLVACFGLWRGWSDAHHDLRQERNLRLLEGIRGLAVAPPPPGADGLPPPPPAEPWIEELQQLEARPGALAPLQVPLSGTLRAPAPALGTGTATDPASAGGIPELLGVVQIPGRSGSAIFQVGGSSSNALVGDSIGNSGWRLVATSGDGAVIERGGVTRRVSISAGF